jgi:tetratricopeptide (TPR) repeat protein
MLMGGGAAFDEEEEEEDDDDEETQKLEEADKLRMDANELFKQEKYEAAILVYNDALQVLSSFEASSATTSSHQLESKINCTLNKASCYLKLNDFDKVIELCGWVLTKESSHPKALYRRAVAFMNKQQFNEALADVNFALEKYPGNEMLLNLKSQITQKL